TRAPRVDRDQEACRRRTSSTRRASGTSASGRRVDLSTRANGTGGLEGARRADRNREEPSEPGFTRPGGPARGGGGVKRHDERATRSAEPRRRSEHERVLREVLFEAMLESPVPPRRLPESLLHAVRERDSQGQLVAGLTLIRAQWPI